MPTCTHCKGEFSASVINLHEARCKDNPDNKPKPKKKKAAKNKAKKQN